MTQPLIEAVLSILSTRYPTRPDQYHRATGAALLDAVRQQRQAMAVPVPVDEASAYLGYKRALWRAMTDLDSAEELPAGSGGRLSEVQAAFANLQLAAEIRMAWHLDIPTLTIPPDPAPNPAPDPAPDPVP